MITITPLSLSWCYTEFGQGNFEEQSPVPFLVWAGEGKFEKQSPVPFLVLHRVWAGEGNFEKSNPLSLSWCYTEFGQGRAAGLCGDHRTGVAFSAPKLPCPFLGVTPS